MFAVEAIAMSNRVRANGSRRRPVVCAVDRAATDRVIRPFAEMAATALRTEVSDVQVAPLPGGSVGPAISAEAERLHASLIVMGSRAMSDARALLAGGSVAHEVIHAAPCPVLVVPLVDASRAPEGGFRRILVAVDGSEPSRRAAETAALLAAPGALASVVHCREVEMLVATVAGAAMGGSGSGSWQLETPAEAEALAESYSRLLAEHGLQPTARVYSAEHAYVASRIVQEAAAIDAELIAMGTRGRSEMASLFLGSVAHAVLAAARRPLLVSR